MSSVIKLVEVSKSFKNSIIFSKLNLEVEQGTVVGFRGRNGSGKSVLMKLIAGMYTPDKGHVLIRGEKLGDKIDYPENVGILVDSPGFIEVLTGFENLCLLAEINRKIKKDTIKSAMQELGLDPENRTRVKNYSLGMKQKLGIIQATMEGQDIVLLDEPFNALDEDSNQKLFGLIRRLKTEGATILLTSHNQSDLDTLCDKQHTVPFSTAHS